MGLGFLMEQKKKKSSHTKVDKRRPVYVTIQRRTHFCKTRVHVFVSFATLKKTRRCAKFIATIVVHAFPSRFCGSEERVEERAASFSRGNFLVDFSLDF